MKGYKCFNSDLTCRDFQFEVGKEYVHDGYISLCNAGFHFCKKPSSVFNYYSFDTKNRVCEVEAIGEVKTEGDKSVTNKLHIIRELSWEEVLKICNVGVANTGLNNSGYYNSGHSNSGDYNSGHNNSGDNNSGNRNSGYRNSGDNNSGHNNSGNYNSGDSNSGYYNSGYYNSGNYNSGDYNSGDYNSGHYNSGHYNSGNYNSGNYNSGYSNSGYSNSGYYNSGNSNSGDYNSGSRNSGDYNSGDRNSGHYNSGDYNSGFFNTNSPTVRLFNKDSGLSFSDERIRRLYSLNVSSMMLWIDNGSMTEQEKTDNPSYKTTGGYLKNTGKTDYSQLTDDDKQLIKSLPGYDDCIFQEITGVKLLEDTIDVIVNGVTKKLSKKKAEEMGLL
jgi:hypothetical protein